MQGVRDTTAALQNLHVCLFSDVVSEISLKLCMMITFVHDDNPCQALRIHAGFGDLVSLSRSQERLKERQVHGCPI